MLNVGPEKILLILLIALFIWVRQPMGPRELPDDARKIGNVVGELGRMSAGPRGAAFGFRSVVE